MREVPVADLAEPSNTQLEALIHAWGGKIHPSLASGDLRWAPIQHDPGQGILVLQQRIQKIGSWSALEIGSVRRLVSETHRVVVSSAMGQ